MPQHSITRMFYSAISSYRDGLAAVDHQRVAGDERGFVGY
jgi:hypothetical protein